MAKLEGHLAASTDVPLSASELVALLGGPGGVADKDRQQAIACFLSASEGWREAAKMLGGAFAIEAGETGLKDGKAE